VYKVPAQNIPKTVKRETLSQGLEVGRRCSEDCEYIQPGVDMGWVRVEGREFVAVLYGVSILNLRRPMKSKRNKS
jgi:hypothetical protein